MKLPKGSRGAALKEPAPEPERDRFGRPYVVLEGKRQTLTRCTTFVGAAEDTYKLGQWQQRHAARGVALHPDLAKAVAGIDDPESPQGKRDLNALVDDAKDRVGAGDSSRLGTYMHKVTEAADRGWDPAQVEVPWLATREVGPLDFLPDLAAYMTATQDLTALAIEQFTVQAPLKVAGTPDRVVELGGKRFVADLKTGSIEWGGLKIAAQLAMYARSRPYNLATHELDMGAPGPGAGLLGAELDRGIVIHLPYGEATCRLYWVDLVAGWQAVAVAKQIRDSRSVPFRDLFTLHTAAAGSAPLEPVDTTAPLPELIRRATDAESVRNFWREHAEQWTDELTEIAKRHIAELGTTTERTTV